MPTLGEELRLRREERGISLTDISESTRIGTRFLKAIEADNFSILPGGIFTRSFIRAYAKEVGMNEDEAIGLYQQQTGAPPPQQSPQSQPADIRQSRPAPVEVRARRPEPVTFRQSGPRTSWPTLIIAGGIVLFIVIIVVALVKQLNKGSESQQQATSTQQAPVAPQPAAQPQPAQQTPPAGAPQIAANQSIVVKLEAVNGESWLGFEADGSKGKPVHLKQGETTEISANEKVKLTFGNRQALKMVINNREATFPENLPKTVAKIEISRDNIQTFYQ